MYDTVRLKSPQILPITAKLIERQCVMRQGIDLSTGEQLYQLYNGDLLGSWDARISIVPKYEDYVVDSKGTPRLSPCPPYLVLEASLHKVLLGHNVYGGPTDFQKACDDLVQLVSRLLAIQLPSARRWTVQRVDVAQVFDLPKGAVQEFFDGIHLLNFPRRQKGASKYKTAVHFAGKTTTVKLYHKGSEFHIHDRNRLKQFFKLLFLSQDREDLSIPEKVEKKISALQRLADRRLRCEVGIHSAKLVYDLKKEPLVSELTDDYLNATYDKEIEKLLREGKQGMTTARTTDTVISRLQNTYGHTNGTRLFGFWSMMTMKGDEYTKTKYTRPTFYRNRKLLEDAGVSWRNTDVVVVANDSLLPRDFAPVRTDSRLCYLPARARPEYAFSRQQLLAA